MDSPGSNEDYVPTFYVGQHESDRARPITDEVVRRAHECNVSLEQFFLLPETDRWQYDMLTAPLTTSHFRNRVLGLFQNLDPEVALTVSPLTKDDTDLGPGEMTSQLLAVASPWIDLCSPDPLVYNISRQVLHLEVAYAAFCGVANIIVPGPILHHSNTHGDGVAQYAYAIQEILETGIYHHVHIRLSMSDDSDREQLHNKASLASYASPEFVEKAKEKDKAKPDAFGTWDAWNIIRSVCKYSNRLFVGKIKRNISIALFWP